MKRITAIELENYRAFYKKYKPINLPKGENLLVYGENGSGKTSLFKALLSYFSSSKSSEVKFELNDYSKMAGQDGSIDITFSDVVGSKIPTPGSEQIYSFKPTGSTNTAPFIKDTALIKGFLSYRNLLDVYFSREENPNLFNLIVNEILNDHVPVEAGESIGAQWKRIDEILRTKDGRTAEHIAAVVELSEFQTKLTNFLRLKILPRLNGLLVKYFDFNILVGYTVRQFEFDNRENVKAPITYLGLQILFNGQEVKGHTEYLNEARLSALSVCLFLAAVLENPQTNFDYKILFLDDVFIGLDSGNRIPIAKILKEEFYDYQIFITTYDRHWYEMAKRFFEHTMPDQWKCIEMYLIKESVSITVAPNPEVLYNFEKPLLIDEESNFSKAVNYLHSKTNPDYPASANYFRKYAEEILQPDWLSHENRNTDDDSEIKSYKLGSLVARVRYFLKKIRTDYSLLDELERFLPTLLHPLSHYELSSPIYKGELNDIQSCLAKLSIFMVEVREKCELLLTPDRVFKLSFRGSGNKNGYYEILITEPLYVFIEGENKFLSECKCYAQSAHGIENGFLFITHLRNKFKPKAPPTSYDSISEAYDKIFSHVQVQPNYKHLQKASNYIDEFQFADEKIWKPLRGLIK